jgi:prepilin-type N-terminal cleavage/methylation domain-containing protein
METHIEVEETKQDKGFTLVELLIVIVILGILATVTVFAVTGITNKGKTSACQSDAKTIQTAEEAFSANTGAYTISQQALVDAGLMHSASAKLNVYLISAGAAAAAAVADNPATVGVDESRPATPASAVDSYVLAGVATSDCTGMVF